VPVSFEDVAAKVEAGLRLEDEEIEALASGRDIITLGKLADAVRRKMHGATATYVRVCDLEADRQTWPAGPPATAGEVRLFHTPATLAGATELATAIRDWAATVPFSAFCLFELSKLPDGLPVVLPALKAAGLEVIAQAPLDRLKAPERALEALNDAGLQLARLTIDETPLRAWPDVCREVAAHQRRLQSIRVFAPLARKVDTTQPTTGYGDVKRVALARLLTDGVDTIQVDWQLYGPKLAQVALMFGADDIDSVAAVDDEALGRRRSSIEEVRRNIEAASLTPVERNGRFAPV